MIFDDDLPSTSPTSLVYSDPDLVRFLQGAQSSVDRAFLSDEDEDFSTRLSDFIPPPAAEPDRFLLPDELIGLILEYHASHSMSWSPLFSQDTYSCIQTLKQWLRSRAFTRNRRLVRFIRYLSDYQLQHTGTQLRAPDHDLFSQRHPDAPVDRAGSVRFLIFGRACRLSKIVAALNICAYVEELGVTGHVFCALFNPKWIKENAGIMPAALCGAGDLKVTIFDDASGVPAALNDARREMTALRRVTHLRLATTIPPNFPFECFTHLSHLAIPYDPSLNVFPQCPNLTTLVCMLEQHYSSFHTGHADAITLTHLFVDRRVLFLPDLPHEHEHDIREWEDFFLSTWIHETASVDLWEKARRYTVSYARQLSRTLTFDEQGELENYVQLFNSPLAEQALDQHTLESSVPLAMVCEVAIDPCLDDVRGVDDFIGRLPRVEWLELSLRRFQQVFGPAHASSPGVLSSGTGPLNVEVLDRSCREAVIFQKTPLTERVSSLSFISGLPWKGLNWAAFPSLQEVTLPIVDVSSGLVNTLHHELSLLTDLRVILPTFVGAFELRAWVTRLRHRATEQQPFQIRFVH